MGAEDTLARLERAIDAFVAEWQRWLSARDDVSQTQPTLEPSPVLTLRETADLLQIHYSTLKKLIAAGTFPVPVARIGRRVYISRQRLEDYIASG